MPHGSKRDIATTDTLFVESNKLPRVIMGALEGKSTPGRVELKPMLVGKDMLLIEEFEPAGTCIPAHSHDDHESICFLISGKMKLFIGDQEFIANAGDAWIHPRGVIHSSEALENCRAVEIKSPPRKPWETI